MNNVVINKRKKILVRVNSSGDLLLMEGAWESKIHG